MKTLGIFSTLRGEDSAGCVIVPRKGGDPLSMKTVGTSFDLYALSAFDKVSLYDKSMFIGHTRKATIGGVTKQAAHPFTYEGETANVHGVHNGTLQRWTDLPCGREVSDSATAFKSIAEMGLRPTVERLGGAYAFIYYDQREKTINFLRNKERTLFYCMDESFTRIYWASESWMLWVAMSKHDIRMANLDTNAEHPVPILPFETDTWFRVKISEAGTKDVITFLSEETLVCDVVKPEVKKYSHPFHRRSPYDDGSESQPLRLNPPATSQTAGGSLTTQQSMPRPSTTTDSSTASRSPKPTLTLVVENKESGSKQSEESDSLDDPLPASLRVVLDFDGQPISREAFEDLTDSTCCFCTASVTYEDIIEHNGGATHIPGIGLWADRERFVCTTCVPSVR